MILSGTNDLMASGTVAWGTAGTKAVNTEKTFEITQPSHLQGDGTYRISLDNSSTTSALTVKVKTREVLRGSGTYAELTRFSIGTAANKPKAVLVQGLLQGEKTSVGTVARLVLSNDTAVGTTTNILSGIRVRSL